jgi:general L-amino acid transport system permease protein
MLLGWYLVRNASGNLAAAGIGIDFSFLNSPAGFDVSENLIAYSSRDTYLRALEVGALNSLSAGLVALVLASSIGLLAGMALTSENWMLRNIAQAYVELFRNLPKLLILVALYVLLVRDLPPVKHAWTLGFGSLLSNRGLYVPRPVIENGRLLFLISFFCWATLSVVWKRKVDRIQAETGTRYPVLIPVLAAGLVLPALLCATGLATIAISRPVLKGFNVAGGAGLSLQFVTLACALGVYHGGQIATIVRGGIMATSRGQREAAHALGLGWGKTMRLVILPQALRIITPPLGNQYSNLIKNTSVALAVGYSDILSVMSTSVNQTFRPIELMLLVAAFFVAVNLAVSALVNWCNAYFRLEVR